MDIGFSTSIRREPSETESLPEIYEANFADVEYAEELGFSHVWNCEHHFAWDQWTPGQFPVLATMAARTSTIRLGTHLLVLPYHHPLRVAEDSAVLDVISGGRLELAVGAGSIGEEFQQFNIPPKERWGRLFEGLEVLRKCYTEEEFDHAGKYFNFPGVQMTTKPLQGELPIWVAGSGPKTVARIAREGFNVTGASAFPGLIDIYDDELRATGRDPKDFGSMFIHIAHVAESRDQAWDECERGIHHWLNFYNSLDWGMGTIPKIDLPSPEQMRNFTGSPIPSHVGTPDEVLESLKAIAEANHYTNIAIEFRHVHMETAAVRRSMDLFAEHVMPELRALNPSARLSI